MVFFRQFLQPGCVKEWPQSNKPSFSENGNFIYVNWGYGDSQLLAKNVFNEYGDQIQITKLDFPQSGLYEYKTKKFLWQITTPYQFPLGGNESIPLNDGKYVVDIGPDRGDLNSSAFKIYENGSLKKELLISDFCYSSWGFKNHAVEYLPESFLKTFPPSQEYFPWRESYKIDNRNNSLVVVACEKKQTVNLKDPREISWSLDISRGTAIGIGITIFFCLLFILNQKLLKWPRAESKRDFLFFLRVVLVLIISICFFGLINTASF